MSKLKTDVIQTVDESSQVLVSDLSGVSRAYIDTELNKKQANLVSGTSLKTINGESVLGAGDIKTVSLAELHAIAISF